MLTPMHQKTFCPASARLARFRFVALRRASNGLILAKDHIEGRKHSEPLPHIEFYQYDDYM